MNTIFLLAAIALFILQSVSMKWVRAAAIPDKLLVNGLFSAVAGVGMAIAFLLIPALRGVNGTTLLFGILFGLLFALTILFYNLAINSGPLSYTTFYFSASMLIPSAAGIVFFHEPLTPAAVGGAALFLAAFYLLNVPSSEPIAPSPSASKKKWLLYCGLTFLFNGSLSVIQKSHQTVTGGTQASGLMLVGFLSAAAFYLIGYFCMNGTRQTQDSTAGLLRANLIPALALAFGSLGGNLLLTYLAGSMSGSYLFPVVQGSIILGVTLVSVFFFRERLSVSGKLGILTGIAAIVVINL